MPRDFLTRSPLVSFARSATKIETPVTLSPPPGKLSAQYCIVEIASRCDGARKRDHEGYGKAHANAAHRMDCKLRKGLGITPNEKVFAAGFLPKYKGQLDRRLPSHLRGQLDGIMDKMKNYGGTAIAHEQAVIPYIGYSFESSIVTIQLPPASDKGNIQSVVNEFYQIADRLGYTNPKQVYAMLKSFRPSTWENGPELELRLFESGVPEVVAELERYGYLVDSRIMKRINDPQKAYFDVTEGRREDLRGIVRPFGFDGDRDEALHAIARAAGWSGAWWNPGKHGFEFPLGDVVLPALEEAINNHRVGGIEVLRNAVAAPSWEDRQHVQYVDRTIREQFLSGDFIPDGHRR